MMIGLKKVVLVHLWNFLVFQTNCLTIETTDVGKKDTHVQENRFTEQYYTALLDYGIQPSENISLSFSVKACHNAFLLLSSTKYLNDSQTYEIVFGSGASTNGRKNVLLLHKNGIQIGKAINFSLNCLEFTQISVFSFGLPTRTITIQLGSENFATTDEHSFDIKGYGIMTGWGSNGIWKFDKDTEESEVVQKEGSTTNSSMCHCVCNKSSSKTSQNKYGDQLYENLTKEEWLQIKIESIHRELKLNKTQLSSSRRKKFCAADDRKSSKQMGIVAAMFILSVVSLVVLIDVVEIKKHMRVIRKIWGHYKKRQ